MVKKNKLGLMTKYLIHRILNRHKDQIDYGRISNNKFDIELMFLEKIQDKSQIEIYIQQLEFLAKTYQVHNKQNQAEQMLQVEYKILNLLGIEFHEPA